jgi:histidyl-tRNA synthetase
VTVGEKGLQEGKVEMKARNTQENQLVALDEIVPTLTK